MVAGLVRHMTPPATKFGPLHALVVGAVLVFVTLSNGLAAFWHVFLHGMTIQFDEMTILPDLGKQTLFFGGLFFILWISTLFRKHPATRGSDVSSLHPPLGVSASRRFIITYTLLSAVPICLIALVLNRASGELLSRLVDVDLSNQDLIKLLTSNTLSLRSKIVLSSFILIEAPLLEELLFRGVLFGGLTKIMPVWGAMLLSGFLFAFIHVNAVTFIPLWFLGVAFAWLYVRTGTLLAPMAVHFTFNAVNLIFCIL